VGIVPVHPALPTLTTIENVMLPWTSDTGPWERRPRALGLLGRVGIADQADKLPSALSGGQQRRAAIARARERSSDRRRGRAHREPDSTTARAVWTSSGMAKLGTTVVIATTSTPSGLFDRTVGGGRPGDGR
jgi:putative ABC transport system ATP-binding protein